MTARAAGLAARIDSIGQLGTVIGALRGIASAHVQRCHACVDGVRAYADTIGRAIAQALALLPRGAAAAPERGATALVLFCAEQGFAGSFSQRVFEAVGERTSRDRLLVIGRRGQQLASARKLTPEWSASAIAHVGAAAGLADRIAGELSRMLDAGHIGCVDIAYTHTLDGSAMKVECFSLLPLDLGRFSDASGSGAPLVQLPPAQLLEQLAIEYLRAQLTEAVLLSFAAENAARMMAMSAARDNIRRTLESLKREASIARQDAITEEVVELAASMVSSFGQPEPSSTGRNSGNRAAGGGPVTAAIQSP